MKKNEKLIKNDKKKHITRHILKRNCGNDTQSKNGLSVGSTVPRVRKCHLSTTTAKVAIFNLISREFKKGTIASIAGERLKILKMAFPFIQKFKL